MLRKITIIILCLVISSALIAGSLKTDSQIFKLATEALMAKEDAAILKACMLRSKYDEKQADAFLKKMEESVQIYQKLHDLAQACYSKASFRINWGSGLKEFKNDLAAQKRWLEGFTPLGFAAPLHAELTRHAANGTYGCRWSFGYGVYNASVNKTVICWNGEKMSIYVREFDHTTRRWSEPDKAYGLNYTDAMDYHNYPCIALAPDGHYLIFYFNHSSAA